MNKIFSRFLITFIFLLISTSSYSGGDEISVLQDELDMVLMKDPCFDQLESDIDEDSNLTSVILVKGKGRFNRGDEIMSSSNVKAIVESYDSEKNQITYYQNDTEKGSSGSPVYNDKADLIGIHYAGGT